LRLRQSLPPIFVISTLGLLISMPFLPIARAALAVEWGAYAAIVLFAALAEAARRRSASMLVGFPMAIAAMHLSWGCSFWWGLLTGLLR
ncbi:MAG TPA: glycosyltransferase family 2 protein, partial [Anaerolineales bacterium]|nr:glycosyltransferase family 2 protein [Anaerolineales bacterium]